MTFDALLPYGLVAGALLLVGWLLWRQPTALMLLALLSLAVRPQLFYGGAEVGYDWGWHQSLLLLGLTGNALRYGLRRQVNWPVIALVVGSFLSLLFGNLHPKLSTGYMLMSLGVLLMPWCFTQVVLEPGSRRVYALAIGCAPIVSVVIGALTELAGLREAVFAPSRLEGATGNAAAFAVLAFAGFAVSLHEAARTGRGLTAGLAALNLMCVVLSGTRMAILSSAIMLIVYALLSRPFRSTVLRHRLPSLAAATVVVLVFLLYLPTLESRMFGGRNLDEVGIGQTTIAMNISVRDDIWKFYWQEFAMSPWVGRGAGSGFIAAADWLPWPRKTPHNEYLNILVTTGAIGFVFFVAAVALWYYRLMMSVSSDDRDCLLAVGPAMCVFAITEDVLLFATGLSMFAYFGVLLTKSARTTGVRETDQPRRSQGRMRSRD